MAGIKSDIKFRVYLTFLLMCFIGLAIIAKAAYWQLARGKELRDIYKENNTRVDTLSPERGNIYSADGAMLSTSLPVFDVFMDFKTIHKDTFAKFAPQLANGLSKLFGDKSEAEYMQILNEGYKKQSTYFQLKNNLKYDKFLAIKQLPMLRLGPNKGGFIFKDFAKRINPFGLLGNRIIGLYRENANNVGLEGSYNEVLKGTIGERPEYRIAGGVWMPLPGTEGVDPINGKDIVTTIDVNTQDIAENALMTVLTKEEATFGTCIVMETKTGAIKAMANLGRQDDGTYAEDYNYALKLIEPGSTFKLTTLLSAIDDGYVNINSTVNANGGSAYFGSQKMSDSHLGLGTITVKEAFSKSSNVACAKLIYNNYTKDPMQYVKHLKALQLDKPTGIDILGEAKPVFKGPEKMFKNISSLAWLAIGYEIMVSPLRTCVTYNTIANNGVMMQPYIVSEIKEYGNTIQKFEPKVITNSVCKAATLEQLKEAAFAVVEEGTGKALKNDVYTICGKTGTAQVADKGIKYTDKVYHGSFVGFFPKDNPLYTICVVIRTKKGANNYYGGQIALPVFKEVADRLYANSIKHHTPIDKAIAVEAKQLVPSGMLTTNLKTIQQSLNCFSTIPNGSLYSTCITDSSGNLVFSPNNLVTLQMPNVIGMGLKDAMYILEKQKLSVNITGKGKVTSQSIAPNAIITKGQLIKITLE